MDGVSSVANHIIDGVYLADLLSIETDAFQYLLNPTDGAATVLLQKDNLIYGHCLGSCLFLVLS